MHYWKGLRKTNKDILSQRVLRNDRTLSLEQELLITMMMLKVGLLAHDLVFRFNGTDRLISTISFTWIRHFSRELSWLITWPGRSGIRRNLPSMFRKYYPKCVVIIDCSGILIQTPSSLDIAVMCWSDYKNHYTVKYLVAISAIGAISYVSDCFGAEQVIDLLLKTLIFSRT